MAKFDYDILVIGGGAAGLTVASGAAQLGARTLIIEKENKLGGDCLHFGCVPSKTLIKSANVYHLMKNAARFGLPEIIPPAVDFSRVAERIARVIAEIQKHDSVERFNRLGAEVVFAEPHCVDEHTLSLSGRKVTAAKIVIATGSSAAVPPIEGLKEVGYITNRHLFSLAELPQSLVVLGAGPIAMEMAQAFCRLGSKVSVIQRGPQILSKEDKDMADMVMGAMKDDGVEFHLNSQIQRVEKHGGLKRVIVEQKDAEKVVEGAEILVALGRQVNTENLGLAGIGVQMSRKGIEVDSRMRTNHKHIYGAGDVCGSYQFTHAAGYEGGIVVSNALFHLPRKANYTWMPWCTYTSPELASIGLNEKAACEAGLDCTARIEDFSASDRAMAEGETRGRLKLILNNKENPIGVQILGLHGGELVGEWVAALSGKVKLSTLAAAVHPYPTLSEINKKAAGSLLSEKIFSDRTRKILKFLFKYQGSSV